MVDSKPFLGNVVVSKRKSNSDLKVCVGAKGEKDVWKMLTLRQAILVVCVFKMIWKTQLFSKVSHLKSLACFDKGGYDDMRIVFE